MSKNLDAYYFPHLRYKVYNLASALIDQGQSCDINALLKKISVECPSVVTDEVSRKSLIRRIRSAIQSLAITGDVEVDKVPNAFKHDKIVITAVNK